MAFLNNYWDMTRGPGFTIGRDGLTAPTRPVQDLHSSSVYVLQLAFVRQLGNLMRLTVSDVSTRLPRPAAKKFLVAQNQLKGSVSPHAFTSYHRGDDARSQRSPPTRGESAIWQSSRAKKGSESSEIEWKGGSRTVLANLSGIRVRRSL